MNLDTGKYLVEDGKKVNLKDYPVKDDSGLDKEKGLAEFEKILEDFQEQQEVLYAEGKKSLLVVLQAMDAGGKDSTIRSVFGPINPQGVAVTSFKAPSSLEMSHDFLWRIHAAAPGKGHIGVFNRSHYEDVLIVKVKGWVPEKQIEKRYAHINNFEKLLSDEGTRIVKFYLNISKDYQKEQFEERLAEPAKNWKFNPDDLKERELWSNYMKAFEDVFSRCSTDHAPWYIIPAERKWFRNLLIAKVVLDTLKSMKCEYPKAEYDPAEVTIPD